MSERFVLELDQYEAANLQWLLRIARRVPNLYTGDWNKQLLGRMDEHDFGQANAPEDRTVNELRRDADAIAALEDQARHWQRETERVKQELANLKQAVMLSDEDAALLAAIRAELTEMGMTALVHHQLRDPAFRFRSRDHEDEENAELTRRALAALDRLLARGREG